MPTPTQVPSATATTLTYRVIAAVATTAFMSVHPIEIEEGYVDASGYGGSGPNPPLDGFPLDPQRLRPQPDDLLGEPGYRFWIVVRDQVPILAIDQTDAFAWVPHDPAPIRLMNLFEESRRNVLTTTLEVLRQVDNVT